jgi:small-conductance mechanosensitive channel
MRTLFVVTFTFVITLLSGLYAGAAHADDGPNVATDRSTPRRAMASFLVAAGAGDYARAAEVLDLRNLSPAERRQRGPELAEMLHRVLARAMWVEPTLLSDDPNGRPEDGVSTERVGTVRVNRGEIPITLTRGETGDRAWSVSAATVAAIPHMYEEYGPAWLESHAPRSLRAKIGTLALWQWLGLAAAMFLAWVIGRLAAFVLTRLLTRLTTHTRAAWDDQLAQSLRAPSRFFFAVFAMRGLMAPLALSAGAVHVLSSVLEMITIGAAAWTIIRGITVLSMLLEEHAKEEAREALVRSDASENELALQADLRVRGTATQLRVLRRVLHVAVGLVAIALMLMQFDVVRSVGVSLLASAGLAGIVIGFAAQRTFGSLIAGIQLSFTQPIRLGDAVVIEGQFGTIEEVTLTYVVVRIWDERRLVVPMTRFLEHPFENWTKSSAQLHGTVFLHADWSVPIEPLRAELARVLEGHPDWDGRTKLVHVTDAKVNALEIRILVSASNADKLARLRFDVRERLVRWLQERDGGRHLPRVRVDRERHMDGAAAATAAS